jgi:DNA mismatch endonuclease (patch repair protein)
MRAVGRRDTRPERMLQSSLRILRLRFSKNSHDLPGSPDIVFRVSRVAAFVHGCFWHRHKGCSLATTPASNIGYWRAKFAANVERDRRKLSELKRLGWKVIVVWQCEIGADVGKAAQRIKSLLLRAQKACHGFSQLSSGPSPSS